MARSEIKSKTPDPSPVDQVVMDRSYSEIVALRTGGRNPPLFCIHDGPFQQMVTALRVDQSIYGLRWLKRESAIASLSLEQLAADHVRQVCRAQERGPYQLIGYSFGGLVAFEMARLLANSGRDVGLLALVDIVNPWFYRNLSSAEAKQFRKIYLVDRIKKYSKNLIQGRFDSIGADAVRFIQKKVKPITRNVAQAAQSLGDTTDMSKSPVGLAMIRSYTPKEFRGRIVLFRVEKAMDGGSEFDGDPSLGWRKYASEGVDVEYVPGAHWSVMAMPNVATLADKLVPYLTDIDGRI